ARRRWLRNRSQRFALDQPLPACRAHGDEPAVVDHAPHGVDADPEHLRRLPKPITRHRVQKPSSRELTAAFASKRPTPLAGPPSPAGFPPPSRPTVLAG